MVDMYENCTCKCLNITVFFIKPGVHRPQHVPATLRTWFPKIDPVWIVGMCACVYVCVSAPEAINN